jgi:hypothetical protein
MEVNKSGLILESSESRENLDYVGPLQEVCLVPCDGEMRVPDLALKHVVYLGHGESAEDFHAIGTGFLIEHQRLPGGMYYLVTADHVVRGLHRKSRFAIRCNDKEGNSRVVQSQDRFSWWYHPTDKTVDAAIFPWGLRGAGFATFPMDRLLNDTNTELTRVGIGDEVYFVGLFRKWAGHKRMSPVVRHGHIAMMAGEPIKTEHYGMAEMHLVEALSLAGMSGSPVLVRQTTAIPLRPRNTFEARAGLVLGETYLLGLVHGIFPTEAAIEVGVRGRGQIWHSGISMVVPSTKILEILNQPKLLAYEREVYDVVSKSTPVGPKETSINPEQETRAKKPKDRINIPIPTREQFERDLGKAVRKRDKK